MPTRLSRFVVGFVVVLSFMVCGHHVALAQALTRPAPLQSRFGSAFIPLHVVLARPPVCLPDDPACPPPDVTITPDGGTFSASTLAITVDWCGHAPLVSSSRQIIFNGVNVAGSFSYSTSPKAGCSSHASSSGTVSLVVGSNTLTTTINDNIGQQGDNGATYTRTGSVTEGALVTFAPHNGTSRDVSLCVANCFDHVLSYSTPSYRSMDQDRSLTLVYRSSHATPIGTVTLDARDTVASKTATHLSLTLLDPNGAIASPERTFINQVGTTIRLAGQFDASAKSSGSYVYTAIVKSYYSDGSTRSTSRPVRVMIVNERNSAYGAGWSVAGLQRAYPEVGGTGITVVDGAGSAQYFAGPCAAAPCTYTSPVGDFTTVSRITGGWTRRYPDGTTIAFDGSGLETSAQDRFANITWYYYSGGRLSYVTDPVWNSISILPVTGGYTITDPASRVSTVILDGANRVIDIHDPVGGRPIVVQSFDASGYRVAQWFDRRAGTWTVSFDCSGHLANTLAPTVTANGISMRPSSLGAHVDMQTTACAQGSPATAVLPANARATTTDARGYLTSYVMDALFAPISITDPLNRVTTIDRDSASRVKRTVEVNGHTVKLTWTGPNVTKMEDSTLQQVVNYTYDSRYNVPTQVSGHTTTLSNDLDASGKVITVSRVGGAATTHNYDARGRDTLMIDPSGHSTRVRYSSDTWSNTYQVLDPSSHVTTYAFDVAGRVRKVTNTNGDTAVVIIDPLGRVQQSINPRGHVTTMAYDSLFLASVTDALGQKYTYNHNALGWMESFIDPNLVPQSSGFDANGNITSQTNRRGQTVTALYDGLNRPAQVNYSSGHAPITYTYDPGERWIKIENEESVDSLTYDIAGRLSVANTRRGALGLSVSATYKGPFGERDSLRWSGPLNAVAYWYNSGQLIGYGLVGDTTYFGYDADRLASTMNSNNMVRSFTTSTAHNRTGTSYGPPGGLNQAALNQAFALSEHLDVLGRSTERYRGTSSSDTTQLYEYDKAGQLTRAIDRVLGNRTCWYDAEKNRQCSYSSETWVGDRSFGYDAVGNRVGSGISVVTGNRLLAFNGFTLRYDADGNLVRKIKAGVSDDSLEWNSLGQLERMLHAGVWTTFGYDGLGRRVRKTWNGQVTRYLWDGDALVGEYDATGNERVSYVYYPGSTTLLGVKDPAYNTYYAATEKTGSVLGLFNPYNTVQVQYRYDEFGKSTLVQGSSPNTLTWHGLQSDAETGLYYARARYYDADLSRFVSEDPISLDGGINPYVYAGNDPVNGSDPSGLCGVDHSWLESRDDPKVKVNEQWYVDFTGCSNSPTSTGFLSGNRGFGLPFAVTSGIERLGVVRSSGTAQGQQHVVRYVILPNHYDGCPDKISLEGYRSPVDRRLEAWELKATSWAWLRKVMGYKVIYAGRYYSSITPAGGVPANGWVDCNSGTGYAQSVPIPISVRR